MKYKIGDEVKIKPFSNDDMILDGEIHDIKSDGNVIVYELKINIKNVSFDYKKIYELKGLSQNKAMSEGQLLMYYVNIYIQTVEKEFYQSTAGQENTESSLSFFRRTMFGYGY